MALKGYFKHSGLKIDQLQNLIATAAKNLDNSDTKVKELESYGLEVYKVYDSNRIKRRLEHLEGKIINKGYLTVKEVEYLKDLTKKRAFDDIIYVTLPVPDKKRSTTSMTVTKGERFTVTEMERLANREYKSFIGKGKGLTDAEKMAVEKWTQAARVYKSVNEEILKTDADVENFIRRSRANKADLDLSFGGQSSLLNDLTYISRAKGDIGRDLVEWLRGIMQDKTVFAKIEQWYQSPAGYELRQTINDATGSNMYNGIQRISSMIEKLLDELAIEGIVSDEQIEDLYNKASAGVSGYMDNSY